MYLVEKEVISIDDKFIMLRNDIVWDYLKLDNTYLKKYGHKIAIIICLLYIERNAFGISSFSLNKLITNCGLKVDSHKGKSLDIFKEIFKRLIDDGVIINSNINIYKAKPNDYIECICTIEPDLQDDKYTSFFMLKCADLLTIINSKKSVIDNVNIYCYILSRKGNRADDSIKDISKTGGEAEVFYDGYSKICSDLMISKTKFSKCLNELVELGLIRYGNIGLVSKDKKVVTANNVYAVNGLELEYGLKCSSKWYQDKGYKLLKK